jgi:APA family basic amino acid/polyamine antiporter
MAASRVGSTFGPSTWWRCAPSRVRPLFDPWYVPAPGSRFKNTPSFAPVKDTVTTPTKQLDRKLGFLSVYAISMGAMMGSGIFVLPGLAAGIAGSSLYMSYFAAGLLALPAVLSKAELTTAMPVAGGTYVHVDRSMGPWMGMIAGLGTWFSLCSKIAFALVGLGAYLRFFSDVDPLQFSLVILAFLVVINIIGVSKASGLQIVIVAICIVALAFMVASGAPMVTPSTDVKPFLEDAGGVLSGAAFVFVSYAGVTKIASIAEEVRQPARNIPLGMLASHFTAMVLYSCIAWVITGTTPVDELATDITPITTTADAIFGPTGSFIFAIVSVVALISMANAGILATSRKPFALSRDDMLPPILRRVSERFGTPWVAIIATGMLLVCLILFLPVAKLAKLASGFKIFIFGIVNVAVIVLRESRASWYKPPFRSPFYPWMQLLGILGGFWLLVSLGAVGVLGIIGAVTISTAWYFGYARRRVNRKSVIGHLWGEQRVLAETERAEQEDARPTATSRVIVPIFGDEPAPERLFHLSGAFVDKGGIEVLRLEEVPEALALHSFIDSDDEGEAIQRSSVQCAENLKVEVEYHDLITHNAKQALHEHAKNARAEWIVMEWPRRSRLYHIVQHPLSWWFDHMPCDLAVFLDRAGPYDGDTFDDFQRIVVLAEPGPYDSLLVHVANRIASIQSDARITLFAPVSSDISASDLAAHEAYHAQMTGLSSIPCESLIVRGSDRDQTIAEVTANYDLLIVGAPARKTLRTLFFGSREHTIAAIAGCSVLKIKAPRHQVHHRVDTNTSFVLLDHLDSSCLVSDLVATNKTDLFSRIAAAFADAHPNLDKEVVQAALLERERTQNTSVGRGVAVPHGTISTTSKILLGVFTLSKPIAYKAIDNRPVDILFVILGPTAAREAHLYIMAEVSKLIRDTPMLELLRSAEGSDAIFSVIEECIQTRTNKET